MNKFLLFTFLFIANYSYSQTLNQYLKAGNSAFEKGEYYTAISYFKKATQFRKKTDEVNYRIGQSYLKLKDYNNSLKAFSKVQQKSAYPRLFYKMGNTLMLTGDYPQAITYYNSFKNSYKLNDFYAKDSDQKIASCYWALDHLQENKEIKVESLGRQINSEFSEFSASYFKDSLLQLTSFSHKEENKKSDYIANILFFEKQYKSYLQKEIDIPKNKKLQLANGYYLAEKDRFYFNQCEISKNGKKRCDIYVSAFKDNKWNTPVFLNINDKNYTSTQASVYVNEDGKDVLLFVSDRVSGIGKKDIWTATETTWGNFENLQVLPSTINTIDDEASPFFDKESNTLYFSSKWHYGYGGYDIFKSIKDGADYKTPENISLPFNSSANDLYFKTNANSEGLLSSNRTGAMKLRGAACCYDIFSFEKNSDYLVRKDSISKIDSLIMTHTVKPIFDKENIRIDSVDIIFDKIKQMLPISVYFHNDEPNPKTEDIHTSTDYTAAYNSFKALKNDYYIMNNFKEIDAFFYDHLDKGFLDLKAFEKLITRLIPKHTIKLQIKGYCSPLAGNNYNINLSKRRISSLENELKKNKKLLQAITDNKIIIEEIPFGESKAKKEVSDDFHNVKESIFNPKACMERKVSIIGILID
tara:strand:- start:546 stop:2465 length:1920 start_codon:yes stop_codon:yes gene_type:complete